MDTTGRGHGDHLAFENLAAGHALVEVIFDQQGAGFGEPAGAVIGDERLEGGATADVVVAKVAVAIFIVPDAGLRGSRADVSVSWLGAVRRRRRRRSPAPAAAAG